MAVCCHQSFKWSLRLIVVFVVMNVQPARLWDLTQVPLQFWLLVLQNHTQTKDIDLTDTSEVNRCSTNHRFIVCATNSKDDAGANIIVPASLQRLINFAAAYTDGLKKSSQILSEAIVKRAVAFGTFVSVLKPNSSVRLYGNHDC